MFWGMKAQAQQQDVNRISWSEAAVLPVAEGRALQPGVAGAFAGIAGNHLLVAGGANFPEAMPWEGGKKVYHREIYVLARENNQFSWNAAKAHYLPEPVAYGASVTLPQGVLCIGGETIAGLTATVYLLQWNNDVQLLPYPDLPVPTANAAAAVLGTQVYVAGGETAAGPTAAVWMMDMAAAKPTWIPVAPLPSVRSHLQLVTQSNGEYPCLYAIGGRAATATGISTLSGAVYRYTPKSGKWTDGSHISDGKSRMNWSAGTAVPYGSTYILLTGGDDGELFHRIESLNAAIKAAANTEEKEKITQEKLALLHSHPGFNKNILLYNTATDVWTKLSELSFPTAVTTTAVKWNDDIIISSGEIKPGTRTIAVYRGVVSKPSFFSTLDYLLLAAYFVLMLGIGIWTSLKQNSTADYFKGGQKIPGWATGLSIFGAKLSAITFVGIPAKTYATDWTYFFLLMTIIMIMPLVVRYFIPFYRRLGVTSSYEFLENRFNYGVRGIAAMMYILLQLGRMGIVILLPSIALSVVTGIDVRTSIVVMGLVSLFYTVLGGIEAVIWTEVVQVIILLTGALLALVLIPMYLDHPWAQSMDTLASYQKLKILDLRFDFSSSTFWVVVIGGFALNLIQYGCDQTVVQRYLTTTDEKTAVKSLQLGAWLTLPSTIIFFAIGTLLFLFYRDHPADVNIALNNQDTIFPWYIVTQLPKGIAGLVITAIFAAAMGSLNGSVNGVATVVVNDFFRRQLPGKTDKYYLKTARIITLIVGLFGTLVAWMMASWGATSLWDEFNLIMGLFTGSVGGLFLLGIFFKRTTAKGAIIGFVVSALVQVGLLQFTHMHLLMYAFTGLVSCVLAGLLFSFPDKKNTNGIYQRTVARAV
ncbi:cyclically-permuted mutarotase family protein [Chitinophaga jiangningensis]|uniref:Cyclically-permuted mutarotase family protein n=2 Tax=Chitinophaga jiangningensis TaxID=1419482 RepID=A0A1M7M2C3_9BACT|nr:cyclically-permuted mutarotase family protein [Chitinophaga jiangningensis]